VLHSEFVVLIEFLGSAAVAPVGPAVSDEWALVGSAEGSCLIVDWLMVSSSCWLGADAITTRRSMELAINGTALVASVEAGRREGVVGRVDNIRLENLTGLLGLCLRHMVVVHSDTGDIALIAGENS